MSDRRTSTPRLAEGDYYVEEGRYVFTAQYLAKRGWCCGNGCRHCPFKGDAKRDRSAEPRQ